MFKTKDEFIVAGDVVSFENAHFRFMRNII